MKKKKLFLVIPAKPDTVLSSKDWCDLSHTIYSKSQKECLGRCLGCGIWEFEQEKRHREGAL